MKLKTLNLKAPVDIPFVPNCLYAVENDTLRRTSSSTPFPLWVFSEDDILDIGQAWVKAFHEEWVRQKAERDRTAQIARINTENR